MKTTQHVQRQSTVPDRRDDKLLQLPEISDVSTLPPDTLRWLRHCGEGPPMFRLGRLLVCWERDLLGWIDQEAHKDAARSA